MHIVVWPLRAWIRMLQVKGNSISAVGKFALALLMVPAFGGLLVLLRLAAMVGVRLRVQSQVARGNRFVCNPPDLIQMYLWLFDVWEPDLTEFIKRRLNPGDGFIDVGANIGYYTMLAARCVGPGGNVLAIEASPSVYAALQETIALNDSPANVRAINMAASNTRGTLNIYDGPKHNTGLTTTVAERGLPVQTTVQAMPLDDLATGKEMASARLVKIDVEGGEPAVLAGMKTFLQQCRPDVEILLELSPNWWADKRLKPVDVLQLFMDAGFNLYQMENNYWPWRYLWPRCVQPPKRIRNALTERVDRLDLVLSKTDADVL